VAAGLPQLSVPAALLALGGLGAWVYRRRRADLWILIGAAALVARLWTYHFVYDDVLILLPLVALFRLAHSQTWSQPWRAAAGALLACLWLAALIPARLINLGWPLASLYEAGQASLWVLALLFLLVATGRFPGRRAEAPAG
jgi:hypothetical protein